MVNAVPVEYHGDLFVAIRIFEQYATNPGGIMRQAAAPVAQGGELSPALHGLLATFVLAGSDCLNVAPATGAAAVGPWLHGHGCRQVEVDPARATALPFADGSFDAALLLGVLERLGEPGRAAVELRRVLRPGGVLLVTAANRSYWRHRLDRAARAQEARPDGMSPAALRRLLLESGFSLVGVEGQDGAFIRDLPLAGRLWRRRGSGPYRVAERTFPALLGSRVGAFAVRL
jgi:SAM-dependent methyltransferase